MPDAARALSSKADFNTYAEWLDWAQAEDRRKGLDRWREDESSDLYDYQIIRRRYDELVEARASGSPERLFYYLNEGLHGNMGGMGSPLLYSKAKSGTKLLIHQYIDEIVAALVDLEEMQGVIDLPTKIGYFRRASGCFGKSALMFSGAGSLGAFHVGVAKTLTEHNLLPTVVSGASAGSVVAAVLGTHKAEQVPELLSGGETLMQQVVLTGAPELATHRRVMRQQEVFDLIEATVPDMTFLEAFEESGVAINISVAPSQMNQRSRLLNATTAPNAMIREAVLASCAVPGVFPPVTLRAKDARGNRRPYVPSRQWIDGSISDDLPAKRLARLYGINHFISSQTNPIVFWMLQDPVTHSDLISRYLSICQSATRDWLRAIYPFVMDSVRHVYPVNRYMQVMFGLATQDYTADINILPRQRFFDPTRLLSPRSKEETVKLINEGERATWPKLDMINNCTKVSRQINSALQRLRKKL